MLVYRYQCEQGFGPYRSYTPGRWSRKLDRMCDAHNDTEHPGWQDYTSYWNSSDWRAACYSVKQLKQWFYGYNAEIKRLGFKIVEVEVDEKFVEHGLSGKQCRYPDYEVIKETVIQ